MKATKLAKVEGWGGERVSEGGGGKAGGVEGLGEKGGKGRLTPLAEAANALAFSTQLSETSTSYEREIWKRQRSQRERAATDGDAWCAVVMIFSSMARTTFCWQSLVSLQCFGQVHVQEIGEGGENRDSGMKLTCLKSAVDSPIFHRLLMDNEDEVGEGLKGSRGFEPPRFLYKGVSSRLNENLGDSIHT